MAEGSGRWQTKHIHVLEGDIGLIKYMRGVHDWHEKRGLHSFFMGYGIRWWLGSQRSIWIWNNLKYKTTTWLFKFHIYTVLKVKMPTSTYLQEPLGRLNGSSFEKYEHLNFSQIRLSLFYQLGCDLMHHKTTTKVKNMVETGWRRWEPYSIPLAVCQRPWCLPMQHEGQTIW